MGAQQLILGLDTSGPYCGVALFRGGPEDTGAGPSVISARYEDMRGGQAERLMPMIEEVLAEAGAAPRDLTGIGVGTGPGNFTGIRIAVSAARGMALALDIPAHGVLLFDALVFAARLPALASLEAPRGEVYLQERGRSGASEIRQIALADIAPPQTPDCICIGHDSHRIAEHLGLSNAPAAFAPASAIARIAALRAAGPAAPPRPFYLKPANAALPREAPPVILDP